MRKQLNKIFILFFINGIIYYLIELIWKTFISNGTCHWSMFLLGGLCGIMIGSINEHLPWEMSIIKQGIIGALYITTLELIFGYILNIHLGLNIWDYSSAPLNFMGQICFPFSVAWFFLSLIAIIFDDILRWKWFDEEKPHYHLKDHYRCSR